MSGREILRFGSFELDPASGELRQRGDPIKLPPQPFKVLELLARHSGQVVTRDEIRKHVWRDDMVVDFEQGLNFCVRRVREVLGDTADAPRFIETLPRRGYRFLQPVTVASAEAAQSARATRLIVLPFRLLRPDPETEFLAFSLPDALAASLGGLRSLVVRSSMAAARFTGESIDPKSVAAEADVDMIVTGTVLLVGGAIRVATQLTDAASGALLWSHTAKAEIGDMFKVQDELTQRIVQSLALPLSYREQQQLKRDVPASARAYEYFLRGNQLGVDPKQWNIALGLYLQSVEEDPGFAPAWARLGRIHHVMGKYLPGTAEGFARAEAAFQRALQLNPELTIAHKLYAQLEVDLGRARESMIRLVERAHTPDPELMAGLVTTCRYCGLLEASLAAHARAAELEPKLRTSVPHTWFLQADHARVATAPIAEFPYIVTLSLAELGRGDEGRQALRELEPNIPTRLRDFVVAARTMLEGRRSESVAALQRIAASDFRDPEARYYVARHLAHLGETAPALELLGRVVAGGFFCHPTLAHDPWLAPLRKEQAFTRLLQQAETQHLEAAAAFVRVGGNRVLGALVTA